MMNRIISARSAAAALAAAAFFALPAAAAEAPAASPQADAQALHHGAPAHGPLPAASFGAAPAALHQARYGRHHISPRELRRMERQAVRLCTHTLDRHAFRAGWNGARFGQRRMRVERIGPRGFQVTAPARLSGPLGVYRQPRPVSCTVRRGAVRDFTPLVRERAARRGVRHDFRHGAWSDRWMQDNGYRTRPVRGGGHGYGHGRGYGYSGTDAYGYGAPGYGHRDGYDREGRLLSPDAPAEESRKGEGESDTLRGGPRALR